MHNLTRAERLLEAVRLARADRPELLPILYSVAEVLELLRTFYDVTQPDAETALARYLDGLEGRIHRQIVGQTSAVH